MKLKNITITPYEMILTTGQKRSGALIELEEENGLLGLGDLAPLPVRSKESLQDSIKQLEQNKKAVLSLDWESTKFLEQLDRFNFLPSLEFALESALFSILDPLPECSLEVSTLLMGSSAHEIIEIAKLRKAEGYKSAKLKIGNLSFAEANKTVLGLKDLFHLRIDVNSAWDNQEVHRFFSQFSVDSFDYIEDPFSELSFYKNFSHPVGIEELLCKGIDLDRLETIPTLKALVYKPTVMGGIKKGKILQNWTAKRKIELVLSSVFESDIGHLHLAATAYRLNLTTPIGIGTYHYLKTYFAAQKAHFSQGKIHFQD